MSDLPNAATTDASGEPWWKSAVVYQIYPRSFADSDGDGVGDLPGIASRLDYLATLGIDVIWLSPVYPSPQDDNGYDISDYDGIEPVFGTLADFDALIAGIHERGMKLVMDLVVNHTSDEHPWFLESRSSKDNPKRDWYWWRAPRDGVEAGLLGAEPTNWRSAFSGPTWTLDQKTGEYYLHLFARKQPDLNWENPDVREAVYAMMRRWLDRGVDGFRMDVINLISKDTALPDGRVTGRGRLADGSAHFVNGPRIHEFLGEMYDAVFRDRPRRTMTVGETPGVSIADAILFTDPARDELDMVFQFEHMVLDAGANKWDVQPLNLLDLKATLGRWQTGLADVGWNSLYWNNHDQPRIVSRWGDDGEHRVRSAKLLGTVLHLQKGTPYVYEGEEIGMTNAPFATIDDLRDIESVNYYRSVVDELGASPEDVMVGIRKMSRDNARTPMQWDASVQAGFTTGRPWLAVNPNYPTINAAAAIDDPDSVFHHYRRLIELRHTETAVVHGSFAMLLPDDPNVYAYIRSWQGTDLLVLANFSSAANEVLLEDASWWSAELVLGNWPDPDRGSASVLRPWESRIYRRTGLG